MRVILLVLLLVGCASQEPEPPKTGDAVWETTGERVLIKGCEDWKKRDPEADC